MMPVFPLSLGAASAPGARKRNAVK
jgi:hypothetical protein